LQRQGSAAGLENAERVAGSGEQEREEEVEVEE